MSLETLKEKLGMEQKDIFRIFGPKNPKNIKRWLKQVLNINNRREIDTLEQEITSFLSSR
jgi:hypothetical protein